MQIRGRTGFAFVFTMVIVAVLIGTALSLLLTPEQANGTATSNVERYGIPTNLFPNGFLRSLKASRKKPTCRRSKKTRPIIPIWIPT